MPQHTKSLFRCYLEKRYTWIRLLFLGHYVSIFLYLKNSIRELKRHSHSISIIYDLIYLMWSTGLKVSITENCPGHLKNDPEWQQTRSLLELRRKGSFYVKPKSGLFAKTGVLTQNKPKIGPSRCARFVFVILCNTF